MVKDQMEEELQKMESPKSTPFVFTPHRKSHLKSETYRMFVRILSHCYDHPSSQLVPPQADNDGEPIELSDRGSVECDRSLDQNRVVVNENFEAVFGLQERGFSETQAVIDEIENIIRIEENGDKDLSKEKELVINDASCGTGLQDRGLVQAQQLLMDELEHVMKGDGGVVCVNNDDLLTMSSDGNRDGVTVVAVSNNEEEQFGSQSIGMEECKGPGRQLVDAELAGSSERNLGTNDHELLQKPVELEKSACTSDNRDQLLLNEELADNGEESSLLRTQGLEAHHQMHEKERELEKSLSTSGTMGFPSHTIEDGEMEEGEVSGEFEVDGGSVAMLCEDAVVPQEKKVDAQKVFEDVNDQNSLPFNEKNKANKKDSVFATFMLDAVDNVNNRSERVAKECIPAEMGCKRKVVTYEDPFLAGEEVSCKKQKKVHGAIKQKEGSLAKEQQKSGGIKEQKKGNVAKGGVSGPAACPDDLSSLTEKSDQTASGSKGITSKEKDAGLCNKKKRGRPSKEKKAKKKQRERKKRAEKNRELGVKRLKLRPVSNPKPVAYCRHFLNGRCQEGDKCKFSHDTIPLTKSKPCCHFARQSCMKGENCPFDHQLLKYPCTNFVSKGSCSRGENCMFLHKLPPEEDLPSPPNVCTPAIKPPSLPGISNSKNQNDGASRGSTGINYDQNTQKNMAKFVQNQPGVMPKGISFVSGGKLSTGKSSHPKPSVSSVKSNDNIDVGNQTGQCAVVTVKNGNEIPKGTSLVAVPKGINFLSFGKSPPDKGSSAMKLMSSAINQGNAIKLTSANNFSVHKEAISSPNKDNSIQAGKEAKRSMTNVPSLNEMLQRTELALPAFGDSLKYSSRRNEQDSLPFRLGHGVGTSVQASKITSDKQEDSSAVKWKLPSSSVATGLSSDKSPHACLKNTPISAQKAVMSTLAFAAKVESQMKQNPYTPGAPAVSSGVIKENGASTVPTSSQIDSAKASKILDFLSSFSSETKK